jgi:hypothetical protein
MLTTVMPSSQPKSQHQDLRDFAERLSSVVSLSRELVISALQQNLSRSVNYQDSTEELLEQIRIVTIVGIGQGFQPRRLSWAIASTEDEANDQLEFALREEMSSIRKALGIDNHWIFLVSPNRELSRDEGEDLMETSGDFRSAGQPECFIVKRFF